MDFCVIKQICVVWNELVILFMVRESACVSGVDFGWQQRELSSYEESYDAQHQLYIHTKHMSTIIHTDWGLPPDLTH